MKIRLQGVRIYGYHGLNSGEEVIGGESEINLEVSFAEPKGTIISLGNTIDYTVLYQLVKNRMQQKTPLLETIAQEIAGEIFAKFSIADEVEISISKLHPPIPQFTGSVGVAYTQKRNR